MYHRCVGPVLDDVRGQALKSAYESPFQYVLKKVQIMEQPTS